MDVRGRAALADELRRPGAEPRRRAAQGHLQRLDQEVRPVHAHRQQQLRRGQGRRRDGRLRLRVVHVPGELPAPGLPEPRPRALQGRRRERILTNRGREFPSLSMPSFFQSRPLFI